MTFETFKTLILILLVGLSLLLTISLWSYQPDHDRHNTGLKYVNEVELGGDVASKRSLIKPNAIIFHMNTDYYGFKHPNDMNDLYTLMQDWTMSDPVLEEDESFPSHDHMVEVIFPENMPMEVVKNIFTLDDPEESLPTWSFQRLLFIFDTNDSTVKAHFLSVDGREQAIFSVNESNASEKLQTYVNKRTGLVKYLLFEQAPSRIFLPEDQVDIRQRTLAVERIEPSLLVDALFPNPALVSPNVGEAFFTDGQRGMNIQQDGNGIEYINPIQSNYEHMGVINLLDESIQDINEHKGWTEKYHLDSIIPSMNQIRYRMHYDSYPIFHQGDLSIIEQQWRNQDLYLYRRPLFRLTNSFGGSNIKLPSGREVIYYLENNSSYNIESVRDIRIGFYLTYADDEYYSVNLEPAWFMDYNGSWQIIRTAETDFNEGGS
ncbi:MAG TPA: two-component system activity regulator YycH [Virgibacillus sp.]|nr:two-component system activity regulator YycH [Virgibacillus sp.]